MKKKIAYGVTGLILGCIFLFPIYILIMNSFKTTKGIFTDVLGFPAKETFTLENYKNAFQELDYIRSFMNSLLITVVTAVLVLLISAMAAWVLVYLKNCAVLSHRGNSCFVNYRFNISGTLLHLNTHDRANGYGCRAYQYDRYRYHYYKLHQRETTIILFYFYKHIGFLPCIYRQNMSNINISQLFCVLETAYFLLLCPVLVCNECSIIYFCIRLFLV